MAGGGGGGRRWQDEVEPELRPRVIHQSVAKVAELYRGANKSLPDGLQEHVGNVEMDTFMTAEDRMDYLRRMSLMVRIFQQQTKLQPAADHQQQMQMAHQIQRANTVQAIQGGNSSFTAIPRAVSTMDVQSMNQHMMTRPFASNDMQINVNQGPSDMMAMLYQPLNSQPATVAPVAQSVQCGQQIMQQIAMQSDNQRLAMQLHPTNVARCHQASMAQLQGQPIAVPNGHHNHLLSPNVCAYPQHLQPTVRQQHFGISQQQVGMQRCQMLGANVANMNNGNHSGGWNNQQNTGWASGIQSPLNAHKQVALKRQTNMESQSMAPAQRQIAVNQQTNMHCPSQQNQAKMGSAREVNWRDEMVQQIKSLKDAYYSELMELDQNLFVQRLTEEQFKSLTKEKADTYSRMVNNKSCIGDILKFLQLEKSLDTYRGKLPVYQEAIHHLISYHRKRKANAEMITRQESKSCPRQPPPQTINLTADIAPFTDGKSNQQKLLADESIGQTRQNVVTTPSAGQKTHSNQLQGVTSPSFSIKSPGPLQSSPINDVVLCCTTSPVNKSTVPSPNSLVMKSRSQSPIAKPGVGAATSSCASVKSTLTSTVEKLFLAADSPCASVKSASPCASVKSACFSNRSPGALQSSPINDFVSCCTTPPTDKLRVPSPNSLLKPGSQSPIAKPGVGAVASPCMSVKSTLTSTVEEKAGFLAASLPCASVKSASPSATAKSSSDSNSSFLLHNNAAVNGSNQTSLSKLLTPDPPFQKQTPAGQAEEQEHGGSDIPVAKKPIDRLTAAVFSLSPAVLRSSVNLMESALRAMDSVPLRIGSNNEMKRVYDLTLPSESNVTLGSMDESTMTFESDALGSASSRYSSVKRQKTQNTKDALMDEIEAVNSRLIDTVISITNNDTEDGITSCNGVTVIKLSYTAVSLAPSFKSQFATSGYLQPLVMPMKLLIPADYPSSSPVIMDDEGDSRLRAKFSCISVAVDAAFRLALRNIHEPRSLKETARAWDSCVRRAITEYAYQLGGGTLSSSLIQCEGWVGMRQGECMGIGIE